MPLRSVLTVDLEAVVENYRFLQKQAFPAEVSAVVKADSYGLGAAPIAAALAAEGCRRFFTAHFVEAVDLRSMLPHGDIAPFHGVPNGGEDEAVARRIVPVINDLEA